MRWTVLLAPMAAACVSAPAFPAEEAPEAACPNGRTAIPAEWAGWDKARPFAGKTARADLGAAFAVGQAIDLTLRPDPEVAYVSLPKGAGEESSFGGLALVHVDRAGRYSVGLGAPAWIDLTRDGTPAESVAHGHGPACSPIHKAVVFELTPGDYVVEISGNEVAEIRMMLVSGG